MKRVPSEDCIRIKCIKAVYEATRALEYGTNGVTMSAIGVVIKAPLSPVLLYFSSLSLLRTVLHYLNAWNRLKSWIPRLLLACESIRFFRLKFLLGRKNRMLSQARLLQTCRHFLKCAS